MKRISRVLSALTIVVFVFAFVVAITYEDSQATAQETTPFPSREKVISVTGDAIALVDPNLLVIQFGVETQEETAKQALESNSVMMEGIIDAIEAIGITEDELSTQRLSIFPIYDSYQEPITKRYTQELIGYRVTNSLMVETSKMDSAASIIDSAVSAGANRVDSVSFTLSPEKRLQIKDDLIEKAILNAKSKAEKALSPLDHQIIGVKSISLSESTVYPPTPIYGGYRADAMAESTLKASTPIFSSDQEVSTTARVIFLIGNN